MADIPTAPAHASSTRAAFSTRCARTPSRTCTPSAASGRTRSRTAQSGSTAGASAHAGTARGRRGSQRSGAATASPGTCPLSATITRPSSASACYLPRSDTVVWARRALRAPLCCSCFLAVLPREPSGKKGAPQPSGLWPEPPADPAPCSTGTSNPRWPSEKLSKAGCSGRGR